MWWIYIPSGLGIALIILIAIILIRTFLFIPKKKEKAIVSPVIVNGDKATSDLA